VLVGSRLAVAPHRGCQGLGPVAVDKDNKVIVNDDMCGTESCYCCGSRLNVVAYGRGRGQ
jgi:hypothetical protein